MKSYLKYAPEAAFGVIASPGAPVVYDLTGQLAICGALKNVIVWNIRTGTQVRVLKADTENDTAGQVTALRLSLDGAFVAVGYSTGIIRIFKLSNGNVEVTLDGHKNAIECLAFGEGGALLASGSRDTDIIVWDVVSQSGLYRLRGHKDAVTSVGFVENQRSLLSTSKDSLLKVWDLDTQHCVQTCVDHRNEVWSLDMQKGTRRILTGASDNKLRVYGVNEGDSVGDNRISLLGTIQRSSHDRAMHVAYNNHGTLLGCQGAGKTIEIFRLRSADEQKKKAQRRLKRAREKARKKEAADGKPGLSIPAVDADKDADKDADDKDDDDDDTNPIANEIELLCIIRCSAKVRSFAFSPDVAKDGTTSVLVSLHNNAIETYALTPSAESMDARFAKVHALTLPGHRSDVRQVNISSDDQLVLSVSSASVKVWNARSMQCVRTLTDFSLALSAVFAPGNLHVVVGTKAGELLLFELASGECIWKKSDAHAGAIWSIDVRPDGKGLATGGADHMVNFWEFEMAAQTTGGSLKLGLAHVRMLKMSDDVLCVKFSHSSDPRKLLVAVALLDCTVKVFYDDSLKFFLSLYGHKLPVMAMDISSDDTLLVTASADKNVKLWGLDFGDCHKSLFAHDEAIMGICFVPRTHFFFTCAKDKCVSYWDGDHFERILKLENNHFGEVWAIAVARDGSFLISASQDRSLVKYARSDDQVFIEEEKEKELESMFEADLNPTNTSAPTLNGASTVVEAESATATKKTIQTVKSGERLIEAIDLAEHEAKSATPGGNILLLGFSPLKYVLRSLREIRAQDLEEALLVLPFDYVQKLIKYLLQLIAAELEVELCCNSVLFLVKVHHNQIVANASLLGELDTLWHSLRTNLVSAKNQIGFNLAGMKYIKRQVEANKTGYFEEPPAKKTKKVTK